MRALAELPRDEIRLAHDAAETVMEHKAYLPPGGLLLLLVGRFRDEIRAAFEMERGALPQRGRERRSLDKLTSIELDTVRGAVIILLQDRFTAGMGDPALPRLLGEFQDALKEQRDEREQLRAEVRML